MIHEPHTAEVGRGGVDNESDWRIHQDYICYIDYIGDICFWGRRYWSRITIVRLWLSCTWLVRPPKVTFPGPIFPTIQAKSKSSASRTSLQLQPIPPFFQHLHQTGSVTFDGGNSAIGQAGFAAHTSWGPLQRNKVAQESRYIAARPRPRHTVADGFQLGDV